MVLVTCLALVFEILHQQLLAIMARVLRVFSHDAYSGFDS